MAFDNLASDPVLLGDRKLFGKVLKNLRSGTMPPAAMAQPTAAEKEQIGQWIKTHVYQIDPAHPDPGRVTVRRLNRVEYRNTIRDLIGVDYDTQTEFPPDDAGHGFDNISDALTLSPLLLEKYLNAAQAIITQAVPTTSKVDAEKVIVGASFQREAAGAPVGAVGDSRSLSYYEPATVWHTFQIEHPGAYQLVLDLSANEKYVDNVFDYNRCRVICMADGQELFRKEYNREGGKRLHSVFDQKWQAGGHKLAFELQPLTPGVAQIRSLTFRINKVTLRGPMGGKYQVEPANYRTFFPKPAPASAADRRTYARELLGSFARRAFRRPVDANTLDRLAALAESVSSQSGQTFETGIAQAMVAVLASPRFLFREEGIATEKENTPYARIDEYALASRLSYFLWASMPDDELMRLAGQGQLRKNLDAQVQRMLHDPRSEALTLNFSGQWLQTRDIEKVPIEAGGTLITGEPFKDIRGLKQILANRHSAEFYRCLTEKLLTYSLGRGLEDYDVESVDRIVKDLQRDKGRFSTLLKGVIESAPFQMCRKPSAIAIANASGTAQLLSAGKKAPGSQVEKEKGRRSHGQ